MHTRTEVDIKSILIYKRPNAKKWKVWTWADTGGVAITNRFDCLMRADDMGPGTQYFILEATNQMEV